MNKDEAMKLALEALDYIRNIDTEVASQIKYGNAAQIIEDALAEQPAQQEPVAWMRPHKQCDHACMYLCTKAFTQFPECATAQQEPVAWANRKDLQNFDMKVRTCGGPLHTVPLYTSPPHRPWVGLTHEDIVIILNNDYGGSRADCIRAAESKLKEKNT